MFKHFQKKFFFSRAFQAPLKSKIKFQGFPRTSRSSTNPGTVPDRSNLTGNALPERLGNAKRNGKGTLRERKRNAKRTQRER